MSNSFLTSFLSEVTASLTNRHEGNYDYHRFGLPAQQKRRRTWKDFTADYLRQKGFGLAGVWAAKTLAAVKLIEPYLPRFEWLFGCLADDQSREILVKVLAYRALGHRRVKLPLSTPAYWDGIQQMEHLADPTNVISVPNFNRQLCHMNLGSIGVPIQLYYTPPGAYIQFVLEQYKYSGDQTVIQAEPGNYVIDAGACWGDTALYFAHLAGKDGRVYSFEFIPSNLQLLRKNLGLNPNLSERVHIVERAVWCESDLRLYYHDCGPGSNVSFDRNGGSDGSITTLTIDDLVVNNGLPHLDFIKMDIEGAELQALRGSVQALKRFRPKLAVCLYHQLSDFVEIPEYLASLDLGYRLYIRHCTIHAEETVLFAKAS